MSLIVKRYDDDLSRTFTALVDPTRRAILSRLAGHGTLSVSDIAAPLTIQLPGVLKHLDVLADAGLVTRRKVGRTVHCQLSPQPLTEAGDWLARTTAFWETRLDNLSQVLEERHGGRG